MSSLLLIFSIPNTLGKVLTWDTTTTFLHLPLEQWLSTQSAPIKFCFNWSRIRTLDMHNVKSFQVNPMYTLGPMLYRVWSQDHDISITLETSRNANHWAPTSNLLRVEPSNLFSDDHQVIPMEDQVWEPLLWFSKYEGQKQILECATSLIKVTHWLLNLAWPIISWCTLHEPILSCISAGPYHCIDLINTQVFNFLNTLHLHTSYSCACCSFHLSQMSFPSPQFGKFYSSSKPQPNSFPVIESLLGSPCRLRFSFLHAAVLPL